MTKAGNNVLKEAMSLPLDIRAELVDQLLKSLNSPVEKEIDRLWADEAERRVKEIKEGKVKAIPGEEVFRNLNKRLGL